VLGLQDLILLESDLFACNSNYVTDLCYYIFLEIIYYLHTNSICIKFIRYCFKVSHHCSVYDY